MAKQEMVCPSKICEGIDCHHKEKHTAMEVCVGSSSCPVCVPVEPAQPELPRELPLEYLTERIRETLNENYVLKPDGMTDEDCKIHDILSVFIGCFDKALERIAQLEAEIASLKEKLAVFEKDIPKGKYCYIMDTHTLCHYINSGVCLILASKLGWDSDEDAYPKAPGCPVPVEEEAE